MVKHLSKTGYLDILGMSDIDPSMHPRYHSGRPVVGDCVHQCMDCDMLRAWNSQLAALLAAAA